MILSGTAIERAVDLGELGIDPFRKENLKEASYTLMLSSSIRVPKAMEAVSLESGALFDEREMGKEGFVLAPGVFVLGSSTESVSLRGKFGCFLSTRSSCAQLGLNILLGSTFAEPDTDGRFTFEIHNASGNTILLTPGMKIVKGVFVRVERVS